MIFNLSQGGVAYLSVTAPSGAAITASCLGLDVTGTGTCTLEVPIIGTWHIVCVFDNTEKTADVSVEAYGETYTAAFDYSAKITVTTFPGADVTATKTGMTALTGTAGSDGICVLTVPEGGLGEWSVESDNGTVTETGTVNVAAYDADYPISLLALVPDITVVIGDDTYNYKGVEITNTNLTISPVGLTGWKLWMKASGTVTFNVLPSNVDVCAVGKGTPGGSYRYEQSDHSDRCGGGGTGGMIVNQSNQTLTVGQTYAVTIDGNGTSFGDIASAGFGGGSSGGGGGFYSPTAGYSFPGSGRDGKYAFEDSSFDGVEYGHGGEGGFVNYHGGGHGSTTGVYANPGAGGAGGGQSQGPTSGKNGIFIMRSAA